MRLTLRNSAVIFLRMISVNQLYVSFGTFDLFKDVSFLINPRDRLGLAGRNGAGKTTLLRILCGLQEPTSGTISKPADLTIGYLPQSMKVTDGKTLFDETSEAFADIIALEKKILRLQEEIAHRTDYETDSYHKLIHDLTEATERFDMLGGSSIHADIERTLLGLGFLTTDFTRATSEFSGGWRMRIEIAKILLRRPNILLLDEPTNHLDIESIQWLEDYLKDYNGAVVLISHDKAFLDRVTVRTVEISLGKIYDYKANYSKYLELRKERRETQIASYNNQQKMIADTEKFIERFRYKATKSVQVQSRIKQLDKIERIEVDMEDTSRINIRFPSPHPSGKIITELTNVSKAYGDKVILQNINLTIEKGDKIAFVGRNGEGKTTLSRIIMGELDHTGDVKPGYNVKTGYFAQNQDELLKDDDTVFDAIDKVAVGDIRSKIRDILGAFLFGGDDIDKKIKALSGGEKSRLAIARLLLEPYNFLVLDEPTNHLDIRSKEILKTALMNFEGSMVIVSHDREFLDGLVSKIYDFRNKGIKEYGGDIYDFLRKKKLDSLQELERKAVVQKIQEPTVNEGKLSYLEKKEQDKTLRKAQNKVKDLETKIEGLETEIANLNEVMGNPEKMAKLPNQQTIFDMYNKLQRQLESTMEEWETAHNELEQLMK